MMQMLYTEAKANLDANRGVYGVARHSLINGDTLIYCLDPVAGKSVIRGHFRTTFRLLKKGEQYSKRISRKAANALL